jgi:hypothetical protein
MVQAMNGGLHRPVSGAILGVVIAFSVTGLPMPGRADHGAEVAHVEHDHGGHGVVLLEQDERLLSRSLDLPACTTVRTPSLSVSATGTRSFAYGQSFVHPGRDPPPATRPRAPPA